MTPTKKAERKWHRDELAPDGLKTAVDWVRPKLGQACTQAVMGNDMHGRRFALVFDNPAKGYWWIELPPLPNEREY